jgi:hypothetical protein
MSNSVEILIQKIDEINYFLSNCQIAKPDEKSAAVINNQFNALSRRISAYLRKDKRQEITIVSNGCVSCPFQNDYDSCNLNLNILTGAYCFEEEEDRHPECPLLTNIIKVTVEL